MPRTFEVDGVSKEGKTNTEKVAWTARNGKIQDFETHLWKALIDKSFVVWICIIYNETYFALDKNDNFFWKMVDKRAQHRTALSYRNWLNLTCLQNSFLWKVKLTIQLGESPFNIYNSAQGRFLQDWHAFRSAEKQWDTFLSCHLHDFYCVFYASTFFSCFLPVFVSFFE